MGVRTYSTRAEVDAEVARVWAVMSDVARWPEWTASVSEVRRLDDAEFAVGSRALIRQPRLRPATWTVETLEPGVAFTWSTASPGVRIVGDHRIVPGQQDAGVVVELTATMSGPMAGFAHLLYGRTTQRYLEIEAAGLKKACES
jgi:uncharacterized membrane protein